jgi:predicted nucleic acid binding AN1-type Zn finger protein
MIKYIGGMMTPNFVPETGQEDTQVPGTCTSTVPFLRVDSRHRDEGRTPQSYLAESCGEWAKSDSHGS